MKVEIIDGVEGKALYFNDYRVAGPKPWGTVGGNLIASFEVDKEKLKKILLIENKQNQK